MRVSVCLGIYGRIKDSSFNHLGLYMYTNKLVASKNVMRRSCNGG